MPLGPTDPEKKVSRGQPARLGAAAWNRVQDAVRTHQRGRWAAGPDLPLGDRIAPADTVLVRNDGTSPLPAHAVVALGPPLLALPGAPDAFYLNERPGFSGGVYAGGGGSGAARQVAVLQAGAEAGEIDHAAVSGVTVAYLRVTDPAHQWAEPVAGKTFLRTVSCGGVARVLWHGPGGTPPEDGTSLAVVNLVGYVPCGGPGAPVGGSGGGGSPPPCSGIVRTLIDSYDDCVDGRLIRYETPRTFRYTAAGCLEIVDSVTTARVIGCCDCPDPVPGPGGSGGSGGPVGGSGPATCLGCPDPRSVIMVNVAGVTSGDCTCAPFNGWHALTYDDDLEEWGWVSRLPGPACPGEVAENNTLSIYFGCSPTAPAPDGRAGVALFVAGQDDPVARYGVPPGRFNRNGQTLLPRLFELPGFCGSTPESVLVSAFDPTCAGTGGGSGAGGVIPVVMCDGILVPVPSRLYATVFEVGGDFACLEDATVAIDYDPDLVPDPALGLGVTGGWFGWADFPAAGGCAVCRRLKVVMYTPTPGGTCGIVQVRIEVADPAAFGSDSPDVWNPFTSGVSTLIDGASPGELFVSAPYGQIVCDDTTPESVSGAAQFVISGVFP